MESRIRRVRRTAKKVAAPSKAQMAAQVDRLNSIANLQTQIEDLQRRMAKEEASLFVFMTDNNLDHMDGENCFADIKQSAGKSVNLIDPKGLRGKLKNDADFYACISVSVTKAKEFLSGKELDGITTTIPGTAGPRKLKVSQVKEK